VIAIAAAAALSFLALVVPAVAQTTGVAEPDGFRMDDFRAPVPPTLKGAVVLDTDAAERLWRAGQALFIDVLPAPARPPNMAPGTLWLPKARHNIPRSLWLADVGFGHLNEGLETYFRHALDKATGGDKERALVFYCLADCWMSWNAAKRAMSFGYAHVHWYPEGTDAWAAAGLELAVSKPLPREE
jgi:PQQ-dependent catabolism-associated CXXCW motif protein